MHFPEDANAEVEKMASLHSEMRRSLKQLSNEMSACNTQTQQKQQAVDGSHVQELAKCDAETNKQRAVLLSTHLTKVRAMLKRSYVRQL